MSCAVGFLKFSGNSMKLLPSTPYFCTLQLLISFGRLMVQSDDSIVPMSDNFSDVCYYIYVLGLPYRFASKKEHFEFTLRRGFIF